jgi:hypothetical protein
MHYIDKWNGESAFIRVDGQIVWVEKAGHRGENVCGLEEEGDSVVSFDVKVDHAASNLHLAFGSTLENAPCEKSFGITGLQLFTFQNNEDNN